MLLVADEPKPLFVVKNLYVRDVLRHLDPVL